MKNTYSVTVCRTITTYCEILVEADSLQGAVANFQTLPNDIDFSAGEHEFKEFVHGVKTISRTL